MSQNSKRFLSPETSIITSIFERFTPNAPEKTGTRERTAEGGAGLLHRILEAVGKKRSDGGDPQNPFAVQFGLKGEIFEKLPPELNGYTLWKPFVYEKDQKVWRLAQSPQETRPSNGNMRRSSSHRRSGDR
jgi:hypothetical protein